MTSLGISKLTVDKVHPFLIYLFEVHHKCTQIQCLKSINVFYQARGKFEIFLKFDIWLFPKWSKLKFFIFEIGHNGILDTEKIFKKIELRLSMARLTPNLVNASQKNEKK